MYSIQCTVHTIECTVSSLPGGQILGMELGPVEGQDNIYLQAVTSSVVCTVQCTLYTLQSAVQCEVQQSTVCSEVSAVCSS